MFVIRTPILVRGDIAISTVLFFCSEFPMNCILETYVPSLANLPVGSLQPWEVTSGLEQLISEWITRLGEEYTVTDGVAVHRDAVIAPNTTSRAPAIIGPGCHIGANAFLRNGVYLASGVHIGIGCEIKSSILLEHSAIAHFNYVGDSIVGRSVNLEAGAVVANHFNEREDKVIHVHFEGKRCSTGVEKFGAVIGDETKIGANAVLCPGTLLPPGSIVKRLSLVEQDKSFDPPAVE